MQLFTLSISQENSSSKTRKFGGISKVLFPGIRTQIKLSSKDRINDINALLHFLQVQESPSGAGGKPASGTTPSSTLPNNATKSNSIVPKCWSTYSNTKPKSSLNFEERYRQEQSNQSMISFHETISNSLILLAPLINPSPTSSTDSPSGTEENSTALTNPEQSASSRFYNYGCLCRVVNLILNDKGDLYVDLEGLFRAKLLTVEPNTISIPIQSHSTSIPVSSPTPTLLYFISGVSLRDSSANDSDPRILSLVSNFKTLCHDLVKALSRMMNSQITKPITMLLKDCEDNRDVLSQLVDLLAFIVETSWDQSLIVLSTPDLSERLEIVTLLVDRQVKAFQVSIEIDTKVQKKMISQQKEALLQEKLVAIKKELRDFRAGDSDDPEMEDLEEKLKQVKLSDEHRRIVMRDLARLKRISSTNADHQLLRTYLEWVAELPWGVFTKDRLDISAVHKILNKDHYGMDKIKTRILEYLSVRKLKKNSKSPILCFIGPPGIGKTSLGKSIANALNREFYRISLGGIKDEAEIRGHRRTYVGAFPGRIIQAIKRCSVANPLILLDEIDKLSSDGQRGDPTSALLEVLDPEQNSTFTDHYLNLMFDLSQVLFIATANYIENIPAPLLDRMEIIRLDGYNIKEKKEISKSYLIPKQIEANGLAENSITFTDEVIESIITEYTREAGVRNLERQIGSICRYYAHEYSKLLEAFPEAPHRKIELSCHDLENILGNSGYREEKVEGSGEVGLVAGLGYDSIGMGALLLVETRSSPATSTSSLVLTGKLGNVIKESAQVAHSWVLCHIPSASTILHNRNIHIHFPAGGISKDGPSAGVAIVTAIVSLIMNKPVPSTIAMTGEITLRGAVLPVGAIKEKVLAAYRAGVTKVLIPKRNINDWENVDERSELRKDFTVVGCDCIEQVLIETGLLEASRLLETSQHLVTLPAKL